MYDLFVDCLVGPFSRTAGASITDTRGTPLRNSPEDSRYRGWEHTTVIRCNGKTGERLQAFFVRVPVMTLRSVPIELQGPELIADEAQIPDQEGAVVVARGRKLASVGRKTKRFAGVERCQLAAVGD